MFSSHEFWEGVMFGAVIGGIIAVVLFKVWEKKGAALGKLVAGKKARKSPMEHDERDR